MIVPRENPIKAPEGFFEWVQLVFSMKRKRIANSLSTSYEKEMVLRPFLFSTYLKTLVPKSYLQSSF